MSLQVKLNELKENANKAITAMRASGLAMTEASEKHDDGAWSTAKEKFEKAKVDFEKNQLAAQSLQAVVQAEKDNATVTNEIHAKGGNVGKAEELSAKKEREANVKEAKAEAFMSYIRYGERSNEYNRTTEQLSESLKLSPTEQHALFGIRGDLGGFLVPDDFRAEVVKNVAGFAVFRLAGARVVGTTSSTLTFPSIAAGTNPYSTGVSGAWRAEGSQGTDGTAPATQDQPTFGQERIPVHVWQPAAIILTRELLADSAVNLDSLVAQLISETKAMDEDAAFLKGTGIGQPRGVFDYAEAASGPAVTVVHSGASAGYTYNSLINLLMTLPAQYRQSAVFMTNSASFGLILQLKDSSQMPILYQPSMPDTLFGKKVFISEQIAAPGADSFSLIFGDMKHYCIAEREDLRIQRLEERFAPNVGLLATARLGGGVLRSQAFVIQQLSV